VKISILESMKLDYENVSKKIEDFISNCVQNLGRDGSIIGLSGGIDSSVVAALSVRALGRDRVFGLIMPDKDSETSNIEDAISLAKSLGIKYEVLDITPIIKKIGVYNLVPPKLQKNKEFWVKWVNLRMSATFEAPKVGVPIGSSLAYVYSLPKLRIRSVLLFFNAQHRNLLVVGTTNKSEYLIGHYDKYGDGACEAEPLQALYKTQVRQLARYLELPKNIIEKPPSLDIFYGSVITDEFIIGMSFDQLDLILYGLEIGMKSSEITEELDVKEAVIKEVEKAVATADFKRKMPITLDIKQNSMNVDLSNLEKINIQKRSEFQV
jgi:NAD+ synthase